MSDFNKPVLTDLYTGVFTTIRNLFAIVAKLDYTGASNIPTGAKRVTESTAKIEKWNGSAWVDCFQGVPVGSISMFGGSSAPAGFALCDGSAISRTTYAALFAVLGTAYGAGDLSTTFNLPDLRQRFPLGKATSGTGNTLGATGGNIDHDHAVPAHYHGKGTLNITSSGTHTTAISHDHSSFNTVAGGGHGHGHSLTASSSNFAVKTGSVAGSGSPMSGTNATGGDTTRGDHSHGVTGTVGGADGTHLHGIDVPAFTGNSASDGAHPHANSSFSGSVGNTGGSNGDASFNTNSKNPPYQVVNYIIKL